MTIERFIIILFVGMTLVKFWPSSTYKADVQKKLDDLSATRAYISRLEMERDSLYQLRDSLREEHSRTLDEIMSRK